MYIMWVPQRNKPHMLIFFQKIFHDFEVKNHISNIKRIELSVIFMLFQWFPDFLFTVLCLSLDWKSYFIFNFALKSFRYVTCSVDNFMKWTHKVVVGKSWVMKLWKTDTRYKIWRMNWTVTSMISCIYFLFLLFEVSI